MDITVKILNILLKYDKIWMYYYVKNFFLRGGDYEKYNL